MMDEIKIDTIILRILEVCREVSWYGPESERPRDPSDPRRSGFARPPASPLQLAAASNVLGFPLPDTYQALLGRLANGGFGPGCGLRGVGGDPEAIEKMYPFSGNKRFDLREEPAWDRWQTDPAYVLAFSSSRWPSLLLPIGNAGCGDEYCLHAQGGQVFHVGPARQATQWGMWVLAPSLEHWLEQWLDRQVAGGDR